VTPEELWEALAQSRFTSASALPPMRVIAIGQLLLADGAAIDARAVRQGYLDATVLLSEGYKFDPTCDWYSKEPPA
jgi:hypothetical protein